MHEPIILLLLLLAPTALLAGCAQEPGPLNPTAPLTTDGEIQLPISNVTENSNESIIFNSCRGLGTAFDYPANLSPAKPPADWEEGRGIGSVIAILGIECERIRWGPFERPMTLIFETHTNMRPPESCKLNATFTSMEALASIWINDSDVAQWAQSTFEMPVYFAEISTNYTSDGTIDRTKWEWGIPGKSTTVLETTEAANTYGASQYGSLLVWAGSKNLYRLNLEESYYITNVGQNSMVGRQAPPMLYADSSERPYFSRGQAFPKIEISSTLSTFGDYKCEVPLY